MEFDVQGILIGLAVFALSAIIIYAISALTMREKTFEQVMEEQRSRHQAVLPSKAKVDKKPKKPKKPKTGKGKPEGSPQPSNEPVEEDVVDEHKTVHLALEPEIIEPQSEHSPAASGSSGSAARNRKKKSKPAGILVNKDEKTNVKVHLICKVFM